ncbi:MAG TPA: DegV family protein [Syntrophomonadaceae bacterium]|nr:DegV family protein [Syntrophomonadaceae bacterium]
MKEKIALLADSACDLPRDLINRYGIKILPLKVIYGDKTYADRVDIEPDQVYDRMPAEIPTTSMPSLHDIKEAMQRISSEGFTHVLAIHLSSGLSGTCEAVKSVAQEIDNLKIKVVDTKTLSFGTGWMVLDAARNIANGLSFRCVLDKLQQIQPQVRVYYIIETLEYLRRGGRIGAVANMLGNLLDIKPIISVNQEGKYFTYAKARGRKKSVDKLVEIVEQAVKNTRINLAVVHGGAREDHQGFLERLRNLPNINELIASDISPVLGVHTGPGLLGICFYEV